MPTEEKLQISLKTGISVKFDVESKTVHFWASAISGREQVTVDEAIVSESKSYKTKSLHTFQINESEYSIELEAQDVLKGKSSIKLLKDGAFSQGYSMTWKSPEMPKGPSLLYCILIGLFIGFGISKFGVTLSNIKELLPYAILSLFVSFIIFLIYFQKYGKWTFRVIKE